MWSSSRRALQDLLTHSSFKYFSQTTCKNTVVVERWWQVPLSKEGSPPRLNPRRHRIYKFVENATLSQDKMELILTQTVTNLGGRGDTVFVKKSIGRNKLLPQGLAVYPSPENKEMFAEELRCLREGKVEERIQTRTGQLTVAFLQRSHLKIGKIPSIEYELTKEIVCRQFLKKLGVVVPPHALRLQDEPIKDLGDYLCEVTVNGLDTVRVPISLVPFEDPSAAFQKMKKQRLEEATLAAETTPETVASSGEDQTSESATSVVTPLHTATAVSQGISIESEDAPKTAKDKLDLPTEGLKK